MKWHFGLGRELGLVLWALGLFEAAYGAYTAVWALWIEHLGAPIEIVGLVLASTGFVRPFTLVWGSSFIEKTDIRTFLLVMRMISISGVTFAAFAREWQLLLITSVAYTFGDLVFPTLHAQVSAHAGDNFARAYSITCTIAPSVGTIISPILAGAVIAEWGMEASLILSALLSFLGVVCVGFMDFSRQRETVTQAETHGSYRALVRHHTTRDILIAFVATIFVLGLGAMLLPNYLQRERGLSPELISVLTAGMAVGTTLFGVASMRIAAVRRSPFRAASLATLCASFGFFIFMLTANIPLIAFAFVLRGGMFASWTFYLAAVGQYTPRHLQTRAFSTVEILGGGALAFSPALAGMLYHEAPWLPLALAGGLGLVVAAGVRWRDLRGFRLIPPPTTFAPEIERKDAPANPYHSV